MLDLRKFSQAQIEEELRKRNKQIGNIQDIFQTYEISRHVQKELEQLRAENNILSKTADISRGNSLKNSIKLLESQQKERAQEIEALCLVLPNILHESVPIGKNEADNVLIQRKGDLVFHKNHYEMDIFEECAEFTGSRFVILKGQFARLERALVCFMMDFLQTEGFEEFSVPFLMNADGLKGSGHLPKDQDNMFKIEGEEKYLIPTGEPVLVNLGRNKRWDEDKKFCTMTDCFRKEAGAAGKDLKGLIRLHQFKKCEMVCFTQPEKSYDLLEKMTQISCRILDKLEIPWQILLLCSGDSPVTSAKTYDIEVPIGGKWREIASISNCTDYQSFNINCRNSKKEFLHILNGSALAVGRTLATFLEVHYRPNYIQIPEVLQEYLKCTTLVL